MTERDDNGASRTPPRDASASVEEVILDPNVPPDIAKQAIGGEQRYALAGLGLGALVALAGAVFIGLGASGTADWTLKGVGLDSHIQTSALGIVVLIAGVLIVWVTRPRVKVGSSQGK